MPNYKFNMDLHASQADTSKGKLSKLVYAMQTGYRTDNTSLGGSEYRVNVVKEIAASCKDIPRLSMDALAAFGEQSFFEQDLEVLTAIQCTSLKISGQIISLNLLPDYRDQVLEMMQDIFRPQAKPSIVKNEKVAFGGNVQHSWQGNTGP